MRKPNAVRPASPDTVPENIVEQAADWQVRLSSHEGSEAQRAELRARYDAWKQEAPEHAKAAQQMESIVGDARNATCTPLYAQAAQHALAKGRQASRRRRGMALSIGALLLAAAVALPAGWLSVQHQSLSAFAADVHTAPGQWRTLTLADGSSLALGSGSAVNYRQDGSRRELELVQGELLVDVAKDPARPFTVVTAEARITALGTRFAVERHDGMTRLSMLESHVRLRRASEPLGDGIEVRSGQAVRIWHDRIGPLESVDPAQAQAYWRDRRLVVSEMPLPEVLDLLGRQRPGLVYFDREALQRYSVSGAIDLDDPERAMNLLATSFPIRVQAYGPWLIRVEKIADKPFGG